MCKRSDIQAVIESFCCVFSWRELCLPIIRVNIKCVYKGYVYLILKLWIVDGMGNGTYKEGSDED